MQILSGFFVFNPKHLKKNGSITRLPTNRLQDMYNERFVSHTDVQTDDEYREWLEAEIERLNLKQ